MQWKNWFRSSPPASAPPAASKSPWPADAWDSVRVLAALYVRGAPPFVEWNDPEYPARADLEPMFRASIKVYQLHLWLSMYLLKRGEVEASMLRDAVPHAIQALVPDAGVREAIRDALCLQADALQHFMNLPDEARSRAMRATGLATIPQWHFARYLLATDPDSPFREPGGVPKGERQALAARMEKACDAAQDVFEPMLQAIEHFDATTLPGWDWSPSMGAHERHLQRRKDNPLFAPERRHITVSDVYAARLLDKQNHDEAAAALKSIGRELASFQMSGEWDRFLNDRKAQIEALQYRILGMHRRGDHLRERAAFLRGHAVGFMRDALKAVAPAQLAGLEKAEAQHAQFLARVPSDWSWQVFRGDVIPDDEAVEALLCEDVEVIEQVVREETRPDREPTEFLEGARAQLREMAPILEELKDEIPQLAEKLFILGVRVEA